MPDEDSKPKQSKRLEGLRSEKIVGGLEADIRFFKYIVPVMYKPQEGNLEDQNPCIGTIVHDWYIVAIAHCFFIPGTNRFRDKEHYVITYASNIYNITSSNDKIGVDLVIIPTEYNPLGQDIYNTWGNLAVVRLARRFGLRRGHNLIKKLRISRDLSRYRLKIYTVAGYGWHEVLRSTNQENLGDVISGRSDGKLRFARAVNAEYCNLTTRINATPVVGNMCAKLMQDPGIIRGICKGDSGAPLVHDRFVIGIAINGFPTCNERKQPVYYINLAFYVHYIEDIFENKKDLDKTITMQLKQRPNNDFQFERIFL